MQHGGAREQQLQMIVEFGHRADGGARRAHGIGLIDGDRGRDAVDAVHLRLVHPVQELPRVRREGLDIAALALRIERVEHQRGLARAADAGDDDQLVERQIEIEILEIILAGAADADGIRGGGQGGIAVQFTACIEAASAAGEMFHHQARAAARDVRDDRGTAMNLGHQSQVDRECQLHLLALAQAKVFRLYEDAVCARDSWPCRCGSCGRT